jgi:hypothetical protein
MGFEVRTSLYSQVSSANAIVSATIVKPIQISKVKDLDFGDIASGVTAGTVVIAPTAASARTTIGGVSLPSGSGTVQSAKFIITGATNAVYSITLPSGTINLSNGTNFMTLGNFTSTPAISGTIPSDSQPLYVGATLNVNAYQQPGIYKSVEDFVVMVNYY